MKETIFDKIRKLTKEKVYLSLEVAPGPRMGVVKQNRLVDNENPGGIGEHVYFCWTF